MIYFWNDKQLARDLRENKLTEKQKISYVIAALIFATVMALINAGISEIVHSSYVKKMPITSRTSNEHLLPSTPPSYNAQSPAFMLDKNASAMHHTYSPANYLFRIFIYLYMGIVICLFFRTNQKGDGKNILERYICLSLPTFIRASVFTFLLSITYGFLIGLFSHTLPAELIIQLQAFLVPIVSIFLGSYYFLRMNMLFKIASGQVHE